MSNEIPRSEEDWPSFQVMTIGDLHTVTIKNLDLTDDDLWLNNRARKWWVERHGVVIAQGEDLSVLDSLLEQITGTLR
jgi:hypothetical protein